MFSKGMAVLKERERKGFWIRPKAGSTKPIMEEAVSVVSLRLLLATHTHKESFGWKRQRIMVSLLLLNQA